LDYILGEHHAIRYTNHDLKALIELHSYHALQETLDHPDVRGGFGLQAYQTKMIQGAIDIQAHKVKDIMIPFERLYTLRIGKKIDLKSAKKIQKHGHSRIPVYMNKDKHAIIGYLLIKTLVGIDLSEGKTISELMAESVVTLRRPLYISPTEGIGGLMTRFKNGKSHMAIVTDNIPLMEQNMQKYLNDDGSVIDDASDEIVNAKLPKVLGIVTLEDVIESVLKEDILDEADYDIENDPNL
jgi:metal transporter CNNM